MKLERVEMENFRQYFGQQRLSFARDTQRNVTVIHGQNGAGKTSLFLAINWCLYGRNVENIKVVDNVGDLLSKEAVKRANAGEKVKTSVSISFLHNGDRYMVKRILTGEKLLTGDVRLDKLDQFTMMRMGPDGRAETVNNPLGTMNAILPVNAREYFLFDGEKIDNFAKPEAAAQVKEAIYLVLKLEMLERSQRHLENSAANYRRRLKETAGGELGELIDRDEVLRDEKEEKQKRYEELKKEISYANNQIEDINQRLRLKQNAKVFQTRRDTLENDLGERRTELGKLTEHLRSRASASYSLAAQPFVEKALDILNEKRERGEIPSNIREQFIQDLLARGVCICGRPITDHSSEQDHLQNLLKTAVPGSLEDDVLDTTATLSQFDNKNKTLRVDFETNMRRRAELIDIIRAKDAELDDVSRQLKGSPLEEISGLENQRRDYNADIDRANLEMGAITQRLKHITEDISELDRKIAKARKVEKQEKELGLKLELAQKAADAISEMYGIFADSMRERIEARTKEIFKSLVWKGSHFQDIRLSRDFNLEVIDRYGQPARPELSAGERQVLSLSFIAAMAQVSEEEAPLVMDTPFGRLSSDHRNNITENLPELANQLVFFVTDEELRDQARTNIEPHIGAEYRLNFDRKTSCTTIEEI